MLDGALVLMGALLLLVPGFITDAIGLLLLLPPSRAVARRIAARNHRSAWLNRLAGLDWSSARGPVRGGRQDYDAEATAADIDEPQLEA